MSQAISHVVGFDDAPFPPHHRGDVLVVGAVYAGTALHGVLSAKVRASMLMCAIDLVFIAILPLGVGESF